jgi:HAE1 family hydrophobic/amphiphilic exporter-1
LVFASGAGAVARQTIGWSVLGGMLAATALGVFVIPVLFILIIKLSYGRKKLAELQEQYKPDEVINPEFLEE